MRLGRCPVCHAHLYLDALVQDEAGRALMGVLAAQPDDLGRALVGYLSLFRPEKSDLENGYFRGIRPGLIEACWSTEPLRSF